MLRMNTLTRTSLAAALAFTVGTATAQDVHFTQFDATPLLINPAFTGAIQGKVRAAAIYRDQWRSVVGNAAFKTIAVSVDAPIVQDLSVDDYLAAGLQVYNDKAGDGNLSNTSVLGSVAYHKFLGSGPQGMPNKSLSVGLQGGYSAKSIDLSKLYFGDEFINGTFQQGISPERFNTNNKVSYWVVNAGISYSQSFSDNFGLTLGVGANNLNQPQDAFTRKQNSEVGLGMRYTGQVGAIWWAGEHFSIRPGVLYQSQSSATELVAGSEFSYALGYTEFRNYATKIFVGGWYRASDAAMATAGVEYKGVRVGVSYDYNTSALKTASSGNGGFEISVRYIMPDPIEFARRLVYPCARF